eukprot:Rmarinus@m.8522
MATTPDRAGHRNSGVFGDALQASENAYEKISDMLLAAGYFRARINTLKPFDKLIGGMAWCLTAMNVDTDLDVDLFFQDSMKMGEKIRIGENICKALQKIKCPFPLLSHQIQGLDYPSVYPVVQWLVKRAIAAREEISTQLRDYASLRFERAGKYELSSDAERRLRLSVAGQFTDSVRGGYSPCLVMRSQGMDNDEEHQAQTVLMEYGMSHRALAKGKSEEVVEDGSKRSAAYRRTSAAGVNESALKSKRGSVRAAALSLSAAGVGATKPGMKPDFASLGIVPEDGATEDDATPSGIGGAVGIDDIEIGGAEKERDAKLAKKAELAMKEEEERLARVADTMQARRATTHVSSASIGKMVSIQSEEIKAMAVEYAQATAEAAHAASKEDPETVQAQAKADAYARQVASLQKQLQAQKAKLTLLKDQYGETADQLQTLKDAQEAMEVRTVQAKDKLQSLSKQAAGADPAQVKKLMDLVKKNEELKAQEAKFKQMCKEKRKALEVEIAKMETATLDADEEARIKEIDGIYEADLAKWEKLRALHAKANREISQLTRLLDDVPTRAELLQYEKRFLELYDEVALSLEENRKYYASYNTLTDTLKFIEKEVALLQSIKENFPKSLVSDNAKSQFQQMLEQTLSGVNTTKDKMQQRFRQEKEKEDRASEALKALMDREHAYFKSAKAFQAECDLSLQLQQEIERRGGTV